MNQERQTTDSQEEAKEALVRPAPPTQSQENHTESAEKSPELVDHTRYGDWEKNGRCIDF